MRRRLAMVTRCERWRGPSKDRDEFHLADIVQNKTMALRLVGPPTGGVRASIGRACQVGRSVRRSGSTPARKKRKTLPESKGN